MVVECPNCQQSMKLPLVAEGVRISCEHCGEAFVVPFNDLLIDEDFDKDFIASGLTNVSAPPSGSSAGGDSEEGQWYIVEGDDEFGPVDWAQIVHSARKGRISPKTLLRAVQSDQQCFAEEFPALFAQVPDELDGI